MGGVWHAMIVSFTRYAPTVAIKKGDPDPCPSPCPCPCPSLKIEDDVVEVVAMGVWVNQQYQAMTVESTDINPVAMVT